MEKHSGSLPGEIKLSGVHNARDLGVYRGKDGRRVAFRRLLRSGALAGATGEDIEILTRDCRLGLVIDLRTEAEQGQAPDPVMDGVRGLSHPILDEQTVGITFEKDERGRDPLDSFMEHAVSLNGNPEPYIRGLYRSMVTDHGAQERYGAFFDLLLEAEEERAVLWHCSAGKDRAGLASALLLTALGADRETVLRDYEVTNEFLKEKTERLAAAVDARYHSPEAVRCARALSGVDRQYLCEAFAVMEKEYGGPEKYLENRLFLTSKKRERLREKFLLP